MTQIDSFICRFLTPDWLTAIGTISASVIALVIALFGEHLTRCLFHPKLDLDARVQRPDAEQARRGLKLSPTEMIDIGLSYFFRFAIRNKGNAAARDVQVFLAKVERVIGKNMSEVDRFTPMNLKWSYTGDTTRKVLLPDMPPVFCDFIHVSDPASRAVSGEDLSTVPPGDAVICLDVEAPSLNKGHLLEPGTYRFDVRLVAENHDSRSYSIEVWFPGKWFADQTEMFDKGFKMKKL